MLSGDQGTDRFEPGRRALPSLPVAAKPFYHQPIVRWALPLMILAVIPLEAPSQISSLSLAPATHVNAESKRVTFGEVVDRAIAKEHDLIALMDNLQPLVETYLQFLHPDKRLGMVPRRDAYFLGRLEPEYEPVGRSHVREAGLLHQLHSPVHVRNGTTFDPQEFTRMIFPDKGGFDRTHYEFRYAGHEVFGDVHCWRLDVLPKPSVGQERFLGRIWVEDQDYAIVRFNGAFTKSEFHESMHLDSWRLNFFPKVWLPVYVYTEESSSHAVLVKAQTRLWAFDLQHAGDHQEYAQKLAENAVPVDHVDHVDPGVELSPLLSEAPVRYSGEENAIERLQVAGLVAPHGEVDGILEAVVRNLVAANQLDGLYDVRCRVLLTLPLDSFSIGHTIFLSRGLLDVVPDKATLAFFLAHELSHIILGHSVIAESPFSEHPLLVNDQVPGMLKLCCDQAEESAANEKALELLSHSQYQQHLNRAAEFVQELKAQSSQLPGLIRSHLRNGILAGRDIAKPPQPTAKDPSEPSLYTAALPLGSRIKLDPWSNRVDLIQPTLVPTLLDRERMPLQVTPFHPYLGRSPLAVGDAP